MLALLIIFCVSLLGIAVMLSLKIYENNTGRQTFLGKLSKHDEKVGIKLSEIREQASKVGDEAFTFTTTKLPAHAIHTAIQAKDILKEKYEKIIPDIRGGRILKQGGKISEYLKEIAQHKKQNGTGRIDEE